MYYSVCVCIFVKVCVCVYHSECLYLCQGVCVSLCACLYLCQGVCVCVPMCFYISVKVCMFHSFRVCVSLLDCVCLYHSESMSVSLLECVCVSLFVCVCISGVCLRPSVSSVRFNETFIGCPARYMLPQCPVHSDGTVVLCPSSSVRCTHHVLGCCAALAGYWSLPVACVRRGRCD